MRKKKVHYVSFYFAVFNPTSNTTWLKPSFFFSSSGGWNHRRRVQVKGVERVRHVKKTCLTCIGVGQSSRQMWCKSTQHVYPFSLVCPEFGLFWYDERLTNLLVKTSRPWPNHGLYIFTQTWNVHANVWSSHKKGTLLGDPSYEYWFIIVYAANFDLNFPRKKKLWFKFGRRTKTYYKIWVSSLRNETLTIGKVSWLVFLFKCMHIFN